MVIKLRPHSAAPYIGVTLYIIPSFSKSLLFSSPNHTLFKNYVKGNMFAFPSCGYKVPFTFCADKWLFFDDNRPTIFEVETIIKPAYMVKSAIKAIVFLLLPLAILKAFRIYPAGTAFALRRKNIIALCFTGNVEVSRKVYCIV